MLLLWSFSANSPSGMQKRQQKTIAAKSCRLVQVSQYIASFADISSKKALPISDR
jgi:hypothetical protein